MWWGDVGMAGQQSAEWLYVMLCYEALYTWEHYLALGTPRNLSFLWRRLVKDVGLPTLNEKHTSCETKLGT
eukprot:c28140_g2_i1 orf=232-444(+)